MLTRGSALTFIEVQRYLSQGFSVRTVRSVVRRCLMASAVHPRARPALHRLWAWTDTGGLTAQRLPLSLTLTEMRFSVTEPQLKEVQYSANARRTEMF